MSGIAQYTVKDALDPTQEIVTVESNETLDDILKTLHVFNLTSAPVIDVDSRSVVGFIDVLDIVQYLLKVLSSPVNDSNSIETDDIAASFERTKAFSCEKLMSVIEQSKLSCPFIPLPPTAKLNEAVEIFANGVHRIPIVEEGKVVNIFSQSQLLKFLVEHPSLLGSDGEKTALEIGLGKSEAKHDEIFKVTEDTSALEAIKLLVEKRLSAVAVVDSEGKIVSQFSTNDLRGLNPSLVAPFNIRRLTLPIRRVVEIVRRENDQKKHMLVWCLPGSKLKNIVEHIHKNRVHRVYMLDSYTNLYGVISITDIARLLQRRFNEQC